MFAISLKNEGRDWVEGPVLMFTCHYYFYYYLKYLALKASQLRQVFKLRGTSNPGIQTALQHMLHDWACVQSSTVGQCEQQDVKKHQ